MTSDIRFEQLHQGPRFSFTDVSCSGCDRAHEGDVAPSELKVVFLRSGSFLRSARGEELFVEAGSAMVFHPDEPYRTQHPVEGGDRCSSIGVRDAALRELVALRDPRRAEQDVLHLPRVCGILGPDVFLAQARVLRDLRLGLLEPCAVEEELLHVVDGYLAQTLDPGAEPASGDSLRGHRELAHRARILLAGRFRERLPLVEVARELDVSLFHLCRVFRAQVGLPLHRYRTRLRLRSVLELLEDPLVDLASLALELGFSSHSHFTSTFRREYGSTPRAFRRPRPPRRTSVPRRA